MTQEVINHVKSNIELFRMFIENSIPLQPSMDVLKPIIAPYNLEFPNQSIHKSACKECLLDMLRWAIGQTKTETEPAEPIKKVKKKKNEV
jgi:hypothetical protein